jgi:hypothetical protein
MDSSSDELALGTVDDSWYTLLVWNGIIAGTTPCNPTDSNHSRNWITVRGMCKYRVGILDESMMACGVYDDIISFEDA